MQKECGHDKNSTAAFLHEMQVLLQNQESMQALRNFLNEGLLAGLVIAYLEPDFPYIFANHAYLVGLGFSSQEEYKIAIQGLANNSLHPDDRLQLTDESIARTVAAGAYKRNHRLQKKNGEYIWVENRSKVFTLLNGRNILVCVCVDISELMRTQEELQQERTMLRYAINGISGGVALVRAQQGRLEMVYASPQLWQVSGYPQKEYEAICRRDAAALLHKKDFNRLTQNFREWIKDPKNSLESPVRVVTKQGDIIWYQLRITLAQQEEGANMLHVVFRNAAEESAFYDSVLTTTTTVVQVVDRDTLEVLYANNKTAKVADRPGNSYFGKKCYQWFAHRETVCPGCRLEEVEREGSATYEMLGRDGRFYRMDVQKIRWRGHDAYAETAMDVTAERHLMDLQIREQKALRAKYEEQEEKLRSLTNSYLVTLQVDLTTEVIKELNDYYHPMRTAMQGKTLEDLRAACLHRFPNNEEENRLFSVLNIPYLRSCYAEGQTRLQHEQEHCFPDGTALWARYEINLRQNPDSGHVTAFISARDITREKMGEAMIGSVIETGYLFVAVINLKTGHYQRFPSRGAEESLPQDKGQYSDMLVEMLPALSSQEKQADAYRRLSLDFVKVSLAAQGAYRATIETVQGGLPCHLTFSFSYLNQGKTMAFVTVTDITDALQQQQEDQKKIEKALEEARRANAARSTFFSSMSHDIRTPLNAILNLTEFMRHDLDNPTALVSDLDKIEMSSKYLLDLVNEVLDMVKIENGKMVLHAEVYPFEEFIHYLDSVISPMCQQKNIGYVVNGDHRVDAVYVDKLRINQVFVNIISNAVKYTDPGGQINLNITTLSEKDGVLVNKFIIEDTGRGMGEEFQKKMFQPFEREDKSNAYSGTGLGLSITKSIVEEMGGTIQVESSKGVGTRVTIILPMPLAAAVPAQQQIAGDEALQNAAGRETVGDRRCEGLRVLVVEDNFLNLEILQRILRSLGVSAQVAHNGREAVECFAASDPAYFDAILMDVRMPLMNGYEATRAIRALSRPDAATVPILAMTAEVFARDVEQGKIAGMTAHLSKPISAKQICKALCQWAVPAKKEAVAGEETK